MSVADLIPSRVLPRITMGPGCWEWRGSHITGGYANVRLANGTYLVHRLTYEHFVGPIPTGLVIDHLCRNRGCVNPAHLEPVTDRENLLRGVGFAATRSRQAHCMHGHKFTPENTRRNTVTGTRYCRTCANERRRKQRAA